MDFFSQMSIRIRQFTVPQRGVRTKRGYGCGTERIDGADMRIKCGADMRIKCGADMRIKRGAGMRIKRRVDMRIKRGWVAFLCELSLNLFRKHVMLLDKTEFAAMFQLI